MNPKEHLPNKGLIVSNPLCCCMSLSWISSPGADRRAALLMPTSPLSEQVGKLREQEAEPLRRTLLQTGTR